MDYFILVTIGLVMGLFGGLLGIGGSVIMIPALVLAFGQNQHLYQASAMICNFFVGISAVVVHKKADMLLTGVIKWLIIIGVAISNLAVFAGGNSYLLARVFGAFLIYVIVYNCFMFGKPRGGMDGLDVSRSRRSAPLAILCGLLTGVPAGLLGIGGGVVCIPGQQLFFKMPLKRAISNSSATIAAIAIVGAFYKNITLGQHNILIIESVKMAAIVIPGAVVGSLVGSRLMYKLPRDLVRIVFILIAAAACYKLLTVSPGA